MLKEHYVSKFNKAKAVANKSMVSNLMNRYQMTEDDLRREFSGNTERIQSFLKVLTKSIIGVGNISTTYYAVAVAVVAEYLGLSYTKYVAYALPVKQASYTHFLEEWSSISADKRASWKEYTHVYVVVNDVIYEYFNGETDNIHHFKSEEF